MASGIDREPPGSGSSQEDEDTLTRSQSQTCSHDGSANWSPKHGASPLTNGSNDGPPSPCQGARPPSSGCWRSEGPGPEYEGWAGEKGAELPGRFLPVPTLAVLHRAHQARCGVQNSPSFLKYWISFSHLKPQVSNSSPGGPLCLLVFGLFSAPLVHSSNRLAKE